MMRGDCFKKRATGRAGQQVLAAEIRYPNSAAGSQRLARDIFGIFCFCSLGDGGPHSLHWMVRGRCT